MHQPRRTPPAIALLLGAVLAALLFAASIERRTEAADRFPNVPLITQDGRTVRFYDDLLKGKAVVINMIYTSCKDRCPLETAKLAQVQRLLADHVGKDIFFYSITIDPEFDSPEVLRAYAEKFHVGPGWLFLTGQRDDITLLQKRLGLYSMTDAANPDGHQPSLMIGNEGTGAWMLNSAVDNPRFLATTIRNFLIGWTRDPADGRRSYSTAAPIAGFGAGGYLFQSKCAACHTIGGGDRIGPDLSGVTERRDGRWLRRFIQRPDQLLAERDPIAMALHAQYNQVQMPNLRLGDADVEALVEYMTRQANGKPGPARGR